MNILRHSFFYRLMLALCFVCVLSCSFFSFGGKALAYSVNTQKGIIMGVLTAGGVQFETRAAADEVAGAILTSLQGTDAASWLAESAWRNEEIVYEVYMVPRWVCEPILVRFGDLYGWVDTSIDGSSVLDNFVDEAPLNFYEYGSVAPNRDLINTFTYPGSSDSSAWSSLTNMPGTLYTDIKANFPSSTYFVNLGFFMFNSLTFEIYGFKFQNGGRYYVLYSKDFNIVSSYVAYAWNAIPTLKVYEPFIWTSADTSGTECNKPQLVFQTSYGSNSRENKAYRMANLVVGKNLPDGVSLTDNVYGGSIQSSYPSWWKKGLEYGMDFYLPVTFNPLEGSWMYQNGAQAVAQCLNYTSNNLIYIFTASAYYTGGDITVPAEEGDVAPDSEGSIFDQILAFLRAVWGPMPDMLKSMSTDWQLFQWGFDTFKNDLGPKIVSAIKEALIFLFVPSDGYAAQQEQAVFGRLQGKISVAQYEQIMGWFQDVSAGSMSNITAVMPLTGQTVTIVDWTWFSQYKSTFDNWVKGFVFIFLVFYNFNFWYKIIRGGPLSHGSGGSHTVVGTSGGGKS